MREETCLLVGIYLGSDLGIHPQLPREVRLENVLLRTLVPHVLNSREIRICLVSYSRGLLRGSHTKWERSLKVSNARPTQLVFPSLTDTWN